MRTPGGSFAEYAVGYAHTTFHLPRSTSFEDGAAVPLAAMTAALGLFVRLGLPQPWGTRSGEKVEERGATPLLVYGGASAVGAYAIKFATKANMHPIIAVAGRGKDFVEGLIDRERGDTIVDYRDGDEAVVEGIRTALSGQTLSYAFDAVSEKGSYGNIVQVLDPHGHITFVLPGRTYEGIPDTVKQTVTTVGDSHENEKDFAYVYFRYIARGLAEGWFKPHPVEVVPGGLEGVQKGLEGLRDGRASAVKYVFRIAETPGLGGK
jgi:NADPH2:quinone reductase